MRNHLFRFEFKNDTDKIAYFGDFLEDEAAQWYDTNAFEYLHHGTFDDFLLAFESTYYNSTQIEALFDRIKYCSQKTSVHAYNMEYAALAAAIPSSTLTEECKRYFYISGLKNPIKQTVRNYKPQTLADAMNIAANAGEGERYEGPQTLARLPPLQAEDIQMDIDAIRSGPVDPKKVKLSNQDRLTLKKLGICFRCRNGQHLAKDCPQASSV